MSVVASTVLVWCPPCRRCGINLGELRTGGKIERTARSDTPGAMFIIAAAGEEFSALARTVRLMVNIERGERVYEWGPGSTAEATVSPREVLSLEIPADRGGRARHGGIPPDGRPRLHALAGRGAGGPRARAEGAPRPRGRHAPAGVPGGRGGAPATMTARADVPGDRAHRQPRWRTRESGTPRCGAPRATSTSPPTLPASRPCQLPEGSLVRSPDPDVAEEASPVIETMASFNAMMASVFLDLGARRPGAAGALLDGAAWAALGLAQVPPDVREWLAGNHGRRSTMVFDGDRFDMVGAGLSPRSLRAWTPPPPASISEPSGSCAPGAVSRARAAGGSCGGRCTSCRPRSSRPRSRPCAGGAWGASPPSLRGRPRARRVPAKPRRRGQRTASLPRRWRLLARGMRRVGPAGAGAFVIGEEWILERPLTTSLESSRALRSPSSKESGSGPALPPHRRGRRLIVAATAIGGR